MKIKEFLSRECIKLELEETEKEGHIKEMVQILIDAGKIDAGQMDTVFEKLMDRERMGSTGIGEGMAIPHVRVEKIDEIVGALGVSKEGIDFDSLDGEPVYISFLLLTPVEAKNEHLKALSEISLFLKDSYYREELRSASNMKQAYKLIKRV